MPLHLFLLWVDQESLLSLLQTLSLLLQQLLNQATKRQR